MASTYTSTLSRSSTFTEARVHYVMNKVLEDLVLLAALDFATLEQVKKWTAEVTTVLLLEAVEKFQIKLTRPSGEVAAVTYDIVSDGSISEDAKSGGLNYFSLPAGTKASIVIRLLDGARKRPDAVEYLKGRGWSFTGSLLEDQGTRDRAYSSSGWGVTRTTAGKWQ